MAQLDPIRALRIIEGLVLERSDESELFGNIFVIAHQANGTDCHKNHPAWTERALEIEKQLVETNTIPAWKV